MSRTVAAAIEDLCARFQQADIDSARLDARLLIAHATGRTPDETRIRGDQLLSTIQNAEIEVLAQRRTDREPISQILGYREFWSLSFRVNRHVLTPRPETETLVEAALDYIDPTIPIRIADLGTGSGCILLSLLSERSHATGVGFDIDQKACETAQMNAVDLGLSDRAEFVHADWTGPLAGQFDLVLSNPPYIARYEIPSLDREVGAFEPQLALVGGEDGLDAYRALAKVIPVILKPQGTAIFELGIGQGGEVGRILSEAHIEVVGSRFDLANVERCLLATVNGHS